MLQYVDPVPWGRSIANQEFLQSMVALGVLPEITDRARPEWIAPRSSEEEPNPSKGYIVSLARLHERGFVIPARRFICALCHHYKMELHNMASNAISQAAVFVTVCEGFLGIEAHWDPWVHLFRVELYTDSVSLGVRRPPRAGGLMLQVHEKRRHLYIPSTMTSNNRDWDKVWFYLRNDDEWLPPYTGKLLMSRPEVWLYGVSPQERLGKPKVLTDAL